MIHIFALKGIDLQEEITGLYIPDNDLHPIKNDLVKKA